MVFSNSGKKDSEEQSKVIKYMINFHNDKFRRDGTPYPPGTKGLLEWEKDIGDPKKKIVKQETLTNGKWVSTVWLGLDHQFGEGKPLIFETMVFPEKGNYSELDVDRYYTEEEALKGHKKMVKKWSKKVEK